MTPSQALAAARGRGGEGAPDPPSGGGGGGGGGEQFNQEESSLIKEFEDARLALMPNPPSH